MVIKILLIDDDPNCLELQTFILRHTPDIVFEIDVAVSGNDGIRIAKEKLPHVILCDLQMLNGNGYDVIEACKRDDVLRKIKVIAITGHHKIMSDRIEALSVGFDGLIFKPLDPKSFGKQVQKMMTCSE